MGEGGEQTLKAINSLKVQGGILEGLGEDANLPSDDDMSTKNFNEL